MSGVEPRPYTLNGTVSVADGLVRVVSASGTIPHDVGVQAGEKSAYQVKLELSPACPSIYHHITVCALTLSLAWPINTFV